MQQLCSSFHRSKMVLRLLIGVDLIWIHLVSNTFLAHVRGKNELVVYCSHSDHRVESSYSVAPRVNEEFLEVPGDVTALNWVVVHQFLISQHLLIRGTQVLKIKNGSFVSISFVLNV